MTGSQVRRNIEYCVESTTRTLAGHYFAFRVWRLDSMGLTQSFALIKIFNGEKFEIYTEGDMINHRDGLIRLAFSHFRKALPHNIGN